VAIQCLDSGRRVINNVVWHNFNQRTDHDVVGYMAVDDGDVIVKTVWNGCDMSGVNGC